MRQCITGNKLISPILLVVLIPHILAIRGVIRESEQRTETSYQRGMSIPKLNPLHRSAIAASPLSD